MVVKDAAKTLGHIAEETAGKIAGDWVKAIAQRVAAILPTTVKD